MAEASEVELAPESLILETGAEEGDKCIEEAQDSQGLQAEPSPLPPGAEDAASPHEDADDEDGIPSVPLLMRQDQQTLKAAKDKVNAARRSAETTPGDAEPADGSKAAEEADPDMDAVGVAEVAGVAGVAGVAVVVIVAAVAGVAGVAAKVNMAVVVGVGEVVQVRLAHPRKRATA